ncbi:MAG: hypothetical protein WDM77_09880 [Steroidobacteraceae bacterium]
MFNSTSPSCRVYRNDCDEDGFQGYGAAAQSYTGNAWTGMVIDTEEFDTKGEFASNEFVPEDYGVMNSRSTLASPAYPRRSTSKCVCTM